MKVFVAGATGAVGRFAVPALVEAGHEVTGIARSDDKARRLAEQGATPVRASLFDAEALLRAVAGHDAVVNVATHIPPVRQAARASAWAENDRIRRDGSATLAGATQAAGVSRYVQESITFTYPDRADAWIDEDLALDVPEALAAVMAAEESARRFTAESGTGVVLRFAALYGPGSEQTESQARQARRHIGFVFGRPDAYVSSLHLADAGTAVVAALSAPAGTYNATDDEPVTKRQLAQAVGAAAGARPWIYVPSRLTPLLARGAMAGLARSHRVSNAKLRHATGWAPRYPSVREGWAAPDMPGHNGPTALHLPPAQPRRVRHNGQGRQRRHPRRRRPRPCSGPVVGGPRCLVSGETRTGLGDSAEEARDMIGSGPSDRQLEDRGASAARCG